MSPGPDNGGVPDGAANARLDDACTTCGRKMAGTALDRMEKSAASALPEVRSQEGEEDLQHGGQTS